MGRSIGAERRPLMAVFRADLGDHVQLIVMIPLRTITKVSECFERSISRLPLLSFCSSFTNLRHSSLD